MTMHLKRTWYIALSSVFILVGLAIAKTGLSLGSSWVWLGVLCLVLAVKRPHLALLPVVILSFSFGVWRGNLEYKKVEKYKEYTDANVVITGTVNNDPVFHRSKQIEFVLSGVSIDQEQLPGEIKIRSYSRNVNKGNTVLVKGKLREGFGSKLAHVYYAEVENVSVSKSPNLVVRNNFINSVYSSITDPEASLGLGFLIGVRSLLPEQLETQLSITGLTHIVAISGYNLTILVNLARRTFSRFSRFITMMLSLSFLGSFLLITGFSPSIVRASIVSVLTLVAWYYGRGFNPIVLLLLSAAISAFLQPLFLWYDIGWHLSFLAFYGVLVIAPALIGRIKTKRFRPLYSLSIETFSAQLMTMPLIMMIFGEVSTVAMLANLLVLPVIPIAMLATFIAGLSGLTSISVIWWLAWPAELILSYIISVIDLMSRFSWSQITLSINGLQFIAIIGILLAASSILYIKTPLKTNIKQI